MEQHLNSPDIRLLPPHPFTTLPSMQNVVQTEQHCRGGGKRNNLAKKKSAQRGGRKSQALCDYRDSSKAVLEDERKKPSLCICDPFVSPSTLPAAPKTKGERQQERLAAICDMEKTVMRGRRVEQQTVQRQCCCCASSRASGRHSGGRCCTGSAASTQCTLLCGCSAHPMDGCGQLCARPGRQRDSRGSEVYELCSFLAALPGRCSQHPQLPGTVIKLKCN